MGTIKEGIRGVFTGKVGTVVGSSWKGVAYMKSRPEKVSNPRTEKQQAHRLRLSTVVQFLKPFTAILRTGFESQALRQSAFNAAVSINYQQAVRGTYPDFDIDYPRVKLSDGPLPMAVNPVVESAAQGTLLFSWDNSPEAINGRPGDRVMLAVYSPSSKEVFTMEDGNTRSSGRQEVQLPAGLSGKELHCWLAFANAREARVSESVYAGRV